MNAKRNNKAVKTSKPTSLPKGKVAPPNSGGKPKQQPRSKKSKGKKQSIPRFTLAQVDPFNQKAFGVKIPDDNTADSCTAFSRSDVTLVTGATNGVGAVFRGNPFPFQVTPTAASQTTWTWGAAFSGGTTASNQSNLASSFAAIRTAAFGIQISTRLSYTAAAGIVHIALLPEMLNLTTWDLPTSTTALGYAPFHLKIPLAELVENGYTITSKYTDAMAFRYIDPGVSDLNGSTPYPNSNPTSGWNVIMVWVEGAPASSTVLDIEYIAHYECLPPATAVSGGVITTTPAQPHSPATLAATHYVNDNTSPANQTRLDGNTDFVDWRDIWETGVQIATGVGHAAELALDFVAML